MHASFRIHIQRILSLGAAALFSVALLAASWPARAEPPEADAIAEAAPPDNEVDPGLRFLVEKYREALGVSGGARGAARFGSLLDGGGPYRAWLEPGDAEPGVDALARLGDPGRLGELEALGARVTAMADDIAVMRIPISRVYEAAALENVLSLEASVSAQPALDASAVAIRADVAHAGAGGLDHPYRGAGVIVGIVDSGVDWSHPDFIKADGHTRVAWLRDYSKTVTPIEWSAAQIDAGVCTEADTGAWNGHGSHCAGIAAGGGRRTPGFLGMAPDADLVIVRVVRNDSTGVAQFADIITGIQYVFQKAGALGMPAVVNLSIGSLSGPHDGTTLSEQAISNLVRPGRLVVVSAGNDGSNFRHSSYTAAGGTGYAGARETLWNYARGVDEAWVDIWYPSTGNISFGVAMYDSGQYDAPAAVSPAAGPGVLLDNVAIADSGTTRGIVRIDARTTADANNGKRHVVIRIGNGNDAYDPSRHVWSVYSYGIGTFDMWAYSGGGFRPPGDPLPARFRPSDNDKTINTPGSARNVICAGALVTKNAWVDLGGNPRTGFGNPVIGDISSFSSHGPSLDGRTLPTLVAPGEVIFSALSRATPMDSALVLQGGGLVEKRGTSMACPHVVGTVALMLERNHYLTVENVRSLLQSTATPPGGGPDNVSGAGKLDALAAVLATPPDVDCSSPAARLAGVSCADARAGPAGLAVSPNPIRGAATLAYRLDAAGRVDLAIYDLGGRRVRALVGSWQPSGVHQWMWDGADDAGRSVPTGLYFARISTPLGTALRRMAVLP
jgi:subtilisin family serine protease